MEQRLTEAQLQQVVGEVQRLTQRHEAELDTAQVREILQELNLSPEFLPDALIQLHRREALKIQQQRNRKIAIGAGIAILIILVGGMLLTQTQQQTLTKITATRDRITLAQDNGGNLNTISRQTAGEIAYRITLTNAPVGEQLSLSCKWIDPSGQIVHQNTYRTKTIATSTWNTICRHTIGTAAPIGTWKVQAFVGDRPLSDANFDLKI
jgi:hypothetical protein